MSDFIITQSQIHDLLQVVIRTNEHIKSLTAFSNGIGVKFDNNVVNWFQLVMCLDGSIDLQLAYEDKDGIHVNWLFNGDVKKVSDYLREYYSSGKHNKETDLLARYEPTTDDTVLLLS